MADGSELDAEDLVGQEIHITSSGGSRGALATITAHCGGSVYAITSQDDTIADCEVDLLLPKGVKWSKWRVAAAVEYDSDGSGSDASGSESEGDPSGSDEPAIACNVHDNSTQEMELEPNDSDE